MAIPSRVLSMADGFATVECFGVERVVSLMLMDEPVGVGDYLIIQSGSFAMEKVEEATALESLAYLETVLAPQAPSEEDAA
ncbi:MAG TPA: HypC/HybG/HupF family hydrogenase formation chaperone [Candidatus Sulfotelmatobacter sp.]|jgi:hydrogenase expression/formation protein HypC|nr:HypC/HybG/HupF family hydrogenase formation chaperone [Candidatus Sulfotelmatobacter sp.]